MSEKFIVGVALWVAIFWVGWEVLLKPQFDFSGVFGPLSESPNQHPKVSP